MADEFGRGKELLQLETVQRAIDESAKWASAEYERRQRGILRFHIGYDRSGEPESPIEAIFMAWFYACVGLDDEDVYQFILCPQTEYAASSGKRYRFDFTVSFGPGLVSGEAIKRGINEPKVALELDGHDFHERTKEQVAYRNERDRDAQSDGWTILHFSGSELYRDPLKCAQSTLDFCRRKHDEWSERVWGTKGE